MNAPLKPAALPTENKAWDMMDGREKAIFVGKMILMVCSMGFIFANVLAPD